MKLGTRIFISGLMAAIVATGTIIIIGLFIDVHWSGDYGSDVKIVMSIFSGVVESLFIFLLVLCLRWVWKED